MRYLRLFSVFCLLTFAITGCRRRQVRAVVPPPQAQAPIVTTLPPIPPLTLPDVEQSKPKPAVAAVRAAAPPKAEKKQVAHKRRHRIPHKPAGDKPEPAAGSDSTTAPAAQAETAAAQPAQQKPSVLGQLSADDTTANPDEKAETMRVIQDTEKRLKKLSNAQRVAHKDDIAQVGSFLKQAQQAWNMNDVVGAQTLANKAKILMDEVSK